MVWTFEGKPIEKEYYCWEAIYKDNTVLKQFDDDGNFHQFREIDQSKLVIFRMVSESDKHALYFSDGMKLIHYYENYGFHIGTSQEKRMKVYCFGYELKGVKHITMLCPGREVVHTTQSEKIRYGA